MFSEAAALAIGGGVTAGLWGIVHWRVKRRDQNLDHVKRDNQLQTRAKLDEIYRHINTIEAEKIPSLEARVDVIEAIQIDYKEMSKLLDSKLEVHLSPIMQIERENSKELASLKEKVTRMEVEKQIRGEMGIAVNA